MGTQRLVSLLIFGLGLFLLGRDSALILYNEVSSPTALGALWYELDRMSLNAFQAFVQRYLHPAIWDPFISFLLRLPAFTLPLLLGGVWLLLDMAAQRRGRNPRRA